MMRVARALAAIVLAGTVTPRVRVDAQQVAYAASVAPELDSATVVAVNAVIARARARGLPVDPIAAKAREGRLKRASGTLIRSAVIKLAERLDSARVALGSTSTDEELTAGAEALAQGADLASLRALRAASAKPVAAPIGTLAQLVASGVTPQRAVEMIVTLLRRNAAPAMVIALGNDVERDVATGLKPNDAAAIRLRGIEGTLGGSSAEALNTAAPGVGISGRPGASQPAPKQRRP